MASPSRHVFVSTSIDDTQGVYIPVYDGILEKRTLVSQFPHAIGLRYRTSCGWMAVPTGTSSGHAGDTFQIPEGVESLVISSGSDQARQILRPGLAADVSRVFSRFQTPCNRPFQIAPTRPLQAPTVSHHPLTGANRKQIRNAFKYAAKKGFEKTIKVAFLPWLPLPCSLNCANILLEGMMTLNSSDTETTIRSKLQELMDCKSSEVKFLSYSSKTLCLPRVPLDFQWTGESVKANIGQGKLYVMLPEDEEQTTEQSEEQSSREVTDETGTPTQPTDIQYKHLKEESPSEALKRKQIEISTDQSANLRSNEMDVSTTPPTDTQDDDDFECFESPTISFRRTVNRNRLSLRPQHAAETPSSIGPSDLSLKSILTWWVKKTVVSDEPQQVLVNRDFVLKSTLRIVTRQDFNFCKVFEVIFSGEDGDDLGGPKREFFRLLLTDVIDSVFQGDDLNKFFIHNLDKLSKGDYEMAGKLTAFSILHGGPGLGVLNEAVYEYMTEQEITKYPSISECVFDEDVSKRLVQIKEATDQEVYQEALDQNSEWLAEKGLSIYTYKNFKEKENMLNVLIKNEIVYSVHTEIDSFRGGLKKVGQMFDMLMLSPNEFKELFCGSGAERLKFCSFRNLYKINFSEEGSNNRRSENNTIYCFEAYLADCEGGVSGMKLENVLAFWTGANRIPPLGFSKSLEVSFCSEKKLPSAHTCSMELKIYRGYSTPEQFEEDMNKSILWAGGFHLV